jgi:hypothetical protein
MGVRAVGQQMTSVMVPLIEAVYVGLAAPCKPLLSGAVRRFDRGRLLHEFFDLAAGGEASSTCCPLRVGWAVR